ncbi:MAG: NAD(+) diphosphatase [Janthinobacterium lividum]
MISEVPPAWSDELSGVAWSVASSLDRAGHDRRSAEWVAQLWRSPDARLLQLDADASFTTQADGSLRLVEPSAEHDPQRHRLLGLVEGAPVFAVEALLDPGVDGEVRSLREVGGSLSDVQRDVAAAATALVRWHQLEPQCPRCGGETLVVDGGYARHCGRCDEQHFPRTDPAVIVAVVDTDDRILLGRQASWGHRVSVLAGFVEAGESLEQTIHREISEEVGVTLDRIRYFGSQPWSFPRSLMTGFFARAATTAVCVDADEIAWAGWFTRDELTAQLEAGTIGLPGPSSIAHRLITTWRSEPTVW